MILPKSTFLSVIDHKHFYISFTLEGSTDSVSFYNIDETYFQTVKEFFNLYT